MSQEDSGGVHAKIRAVLDELYGLYGDAGPSIEVPVERERAAPLAHGWYTAVRRLGKAILILDVNGYEHEAAPLRRSQIEHALALHWLADAPDGAVDSLRRAYRERVNRMKESMDSTWSVPTELIDSILAVDVDASAEDHYLSFKHLCDRYDLPNLYVAWLTETGFSHATFSSAQAYVGSDDEGRPMLLPRVRDSHIDDRIVVAVAMHVASQGFNRQLAGEPWTEALVDIDQQLSAIQQQAVN